jgi:hypothetical protein
MGPRNPFPPGTQSTTAMIATLALLVLTPPAASDASCPPAAHLDGARRLVGAVGRLLRAHGVTVDPASCSSAAVRVSIEAPPRGAPLTLHIRDRFGRASDREVADVDTAASLIETWALREDESLVAPPALPPAPALVAAPKAVVPAAAPWVVDASIEAAAASDGSVWYGPTLGACGLVGRLCVGGRARVARDAGRGGPPDDHVYTRTDVDVLATVGAELGSGRVTLTPRIGVGAGRASSSRPALPGTTSAPSSASTGPRGEAGAIAALALSRRWSIFFEGNAMLARLGAGESGAAALQCPTAYFRAALGLRIAP